MTCRHSLQLHVVNEAHTDLLKKQGRYKLCTNGRGSLSICGRLIWAAWLCAVLIAPMGTLPHRLLRNAWFGRVLRAVFAWHPISPGPRW